MEHFWYAFVGGIGGTMSSLFLCLCMFVYLDKREERADERRRLLLEANDNPRPARVKTQAAADAKSDSGVWWGREEAPPRVVKPFATPMPTFWRR
jgi:cbb3-type cytochrome oxidase subunit 3